MYKILSIIMVLTFIFAGCAQAVRYNGLSGDLIHAQKDTILMDSINNLPRIPFSTGL